MSYLDNTKFWADKKGHILTFEHIATGLSASFKAFVTSFSDNFESNWNSEDVYGRMDPIQTFQGTKRTIDVEWDVVASSAIEAMNNQNWCSKLFRMLYPVYESTGSSSTMQASPLLRLKFANLIQDVNTGGGLVGTSSGFSYTPDFDYGVFDLANGELYPKVIKLKCTFTVLHTHNLGFTAGNHHWNDGPGFPYEYNEPPPSIEERAAAADKAILDAEKAKEDAQKMSGALALLFGAVEGTAEKDRQASAARHAKRHASHARSLELITTTAMDAIILIPKPTLPVFHFLIAVLTYPSLLHNELSASTRLLMVPAVKYLQLIPKW